MLDSVEHLRNSDQLRQLFSHYAKQGAANPEAWHPRLAQLDCDGRIDLVKLDGELIAFDFVVPNPGQTPCKYRLTRAGLKAIREIENSPDDEPGTLDIGNQAA